MIARCILMHANDFLYRDSSIGGVVIINFYISAILTFLSEVNRITKFVTTLKYFA